MTLSELKNKTEQLLSDLDLVISELEPDFNCEHLLITESSNRIKYYRKQDGTVQQSIPKNDPRLKQLAQNTYNRRLLKAAEKEYAAVKRALEILEKCKSDVDKVFDSLPKEVAALVEPFKGTREEFALRWQKSKFPRKHVPNDIGFYTSKGEHVRSKSELIIAERLKENNIPYHYEMPVSLDDINVQNPDFTVLNTKTGEVFFWEHFGMMDDAKYCSGAFYKLYNYADNGFFIGKNLIITFESSAVPLNTKYVDKIIGEFLK